MHPPAWIVARGNGKIREVYHQDRDSVKEGSIIAVLDNPAKTADAMWLKRELKNYVSTDSIVNIIRFTENLSLGSMQNAYASFLKALTNYHNFQSLEFIPTKDRGYTTRTA